MAKVELDAIDQKILRYLTVNARMPFLEIARECGVSGAAIHQRVNKLVAQGVILGTQMVVDPKSLGNDVCAIVEVQTRDINNYMEIVEALKAIPEVVSCNFITGKSNLLLKLYCRDHAHFMNVLMEKVRKIDGVIATETYISLFEAFSRQVQIDETK
ncbi:MAG: Lrp/AsnC ligand binding domain-containing protein [Rikenellaceae bacterium]|nr:Lrp/AsnC ligand binding domain-containing protein [Rikenellaceae bacterium]